MAGPLNIAGASIAEAPILFPGRPLIATPAVSAVAGTDDDARFEASALRLLRGEEPCYFCTFSGKCTRVTVFLSEEELACDACANAWDEQFVGSRRHCNGKPKPMCKRCDLVYNDQVACCPTHRLRGLFSPDEARMDFEGSTASSVYPRLRLEHHRLQIRSLLDIILAYEQEIHRLRERVHRHHQSIDAVLRGHVCLTVREHFALTDPDANERGRRSTGGGAAGAGAAAPVRGEHRAIHTCVEHE